MRITSVAPGPILAAELAGRQAFQGASFGLFAFMRLVPMGKPINDRHGSKSRPTLLRNHPDRPQPRLYQIRPSRYRKLRAPQPKGMLAFRV
jgi:hypothetical protein